MPSWTVADLCVVPAYIAAADQTFTAGLLARQPRGCGHGVRGVLEIADAVVLIGVRQKGFKKIDVLLGITREVYCASDLLLENTCKISSRMAQHYRPKTQDKVVIIAALGVCDKRTTTLPKEDLLPV
ncbi:hypothetical protein ASB65_21140 [Agrobacterium tumefaciens str. B6]|nr:hypothetical protein ASB65_21140 [Agrobacterium tumefaciens str. B6]OCJ39244.1 hypothetical protein A6U90_20940 [Agrobacterium tumefaciens]